MRLRATLVVMVAAGLMAMTSSVQAQGITTRADSLAVLTAAASTARHDLLLPGLRHVVARENRTAHGVAWDAATTRALQRALTNGHEPAAVSCSTAVDACQFDATTQVLFVGVPNSFGDSVTVEVTVTQVVPRRTQSALSVRSKLYVLIKRAGVWAVDHVALASAT